MRPSHPAFRIALSIVSFLSQPWSGATSGRYVAVIGRLFMKCDEALSRDGEDEYGDGVFDEEFDLVVVSAVGCEKDMYTPCTPTVQSRYEDASSKSWSSEILHGDI